MPALVPVPCYATDQVQGVGPDRGRKLPPPNEPVAEPPPLGHLELRPYLRRCLDVMQPGETVPAALRCGWVLLWGSNCCLRELGGCSISNHQQLAGVRAFLLNLLG